MRGVGAGGGGGFGFGGSGVGVVTDHDRVTDVPVHVIEVCAGVVTTY